MGAYDIEVKPEATISRFEINVRYYHIEIYWPRITTIHDQNLQPITQSQTESMVAIQGHASERVVKCKVLHIHVEAE